MFNDTIPSTTVKNQRHCLSDDLDQWLKKNKPTVLPRGASLGELKFTDNAKVKRDIQQEERVKKETIERNKIIAAQNKERERLAKLKMQQMKQMQKEVERKAAVERQIELLAPFYEKAKRADVTNLSKLIGITPLDLRLAVKKKALTDEQFKALTAALDNFQWFVPKPRKCGKHKSNKSRRKLTQEQIERKQRWNANHKAKKEAQAKGLTEFMGVCEFHGQTKYIIVNGVRCVCCKKEKTRQYTESKQTPEKKAKFERQEQNRKEMLSAIESGLMNFDGLCEKHGITNFLIFKYDTGIPTRSPYRIKCQRCKNDYAAELKRKRKQVATDKVAVV